jgi:hypothetical protein
MDKETLISTLKSEDSLMFEIVKELARNIGNDSDLGAAVRKVIKNQQLKTDKEWTQVPTKRKKK